MSLIRHNIFGRSSGSGLRRKSWSNDALMNTQRCQTEFAPYGGDVVTVGVPHFFEQPVHPQALDQPTQLTGAQFREKGPQTTMAQACGGKVCTQDRAQHLTLAGPQQIETTITSVLFISFGFSQTINFHSARALIIERREPFQIAA